MKTSMMKSKKALLGTALAVVLGVSSVAAIAGDRLKDDQAGFRGDRDNEDRPVCDERDNDRGHMQQSGFRDGRGDRDGHGDRDGRGGMMDGRGFGPQMAGMQGMGPGMGAGMAPGMMGGQPDMMGFGMRGVDLTDSQQTAMTKLQDQIRKDHWVARGAMMDVQNKLRDLYMADKFDEKAINKAYGEMAEIQQKLFLSTTKARTSMMALLTDEQRTSLKEMRKHPKRDIERTKS
ncbi:Spy/CpxP family protein refolding chaperone [Oceanobacter mangrovi]|uniref:Spy/CpxP family protein refolding chaperone n=1 Tax=Oceanobacter mangrovi TaxID=2862510 RepID=UPI001C8D89FE|nr:Spy/CpxP family protein refolding chaperone [Oceanobacter mangrovi]